MALNKTGFTLWVAVGLFLLLNASTSLANVLDDAELNSSAAADGSDTNTLPENNPADNLKALSAIIMQSAGNDPKQRVLAAYIVRLIQRRDARGLLAFIRKLNQQIVYNQRLAKCIASLGSKAICENNTAFYLWAQMLAKEIMEGN